MGQTRETKKVQGVKVGHLSKAPESRFSAWAKLRVMQGHEHGGAKGDLGDIHRAEDGEAAQALLARN